MFSRRSFDDEMVNDVRTRINSGYSHDAAVTHARVHWNLDRETAERLIAHVDRQEIASQIAIQPTPTTPESAGQSSRVPWRVLIFVVFTALSLLGEVFTDTPIGVVLTTMLIAFVIWRYYRLLRWVGIKLGIVTDADEYSDASRPESWSSRLERGVSSGNILSVFRTRSVAILTAIAVIVAVGVIFVFVVSPAVKQPPATSVIWTEDKTTQVEPGLLRFEGRITNGDQDWSMANLVMTTSFLNEAGLLVSQKRTELIIDRVHPSQTRFYSYDVSVFESFDSYQSNFEYKWKK